MKKLRLAFLYISLVFISSAFSFSCEKSLVQIWPSGFGNYTSGTYYEDTCKDSPTYGELYQKSTWVITFRNNIFKDAIKTGTEMSLDDINSSKFPDLYLVLSDMQKKFGKITFSNDLDINGLNYSVSLDHTVNIRFDKINRSKDIIYSFATLPGSRNFWLKRNSQSNNSGC